MAEKHSSRKDGEPRVPVRMDLRESLVDKLDERRRTTGRTRVDTVERMLEWALAQPAEAAPVERRRV